MWQSSSDVEITKNYEIGKEQDLTKDCYFNVNFKTGFSTYIKCK